MELVLELELEPVLRRLSGERVVSVELVEGDDTRIRGESNPGLYPLRCKPVVGDFNLEGVGEVDEFWVPEPGETDLAEDGGVGGRRIKEPPLGNLDRRG